MMKLINLNVECGITYEPLVEFIKKHSDIDIFCFQEVFHNAVEMRSILGDKARPNFFPELQMILPDFAGYHFPTQEGDFGGLAIFIKKSFTVNNINNIVIFQDLKVMRDENDKDYFSMGRNLQNLNFHYSGKNYSLFNFHGMWITEGKKDTPKRIEQSQKIREIFDKTKGPRILCTDLNVEPNTESLKILCKGNRDLVKESGVVSTRSSQKERQEIVDYIIVSPEVKVLDFRVLQDSVSNHLPLLLKFT